MHHAFVIEAEGESGAALAREWAARELGMEGAANPDIVVLPYGLFSVEDARRVAEVAMQGPVAGEHKAIIIAASRAYREAQNALLKLFEEPPAGTYLFLILPSLGGLLPTLRSRVHVLEVTSSKYHVASISEAAQAFLKASREKRGAMVKKLVAGKDEEERRAHRDKAIALVNGIEAATYVHFHANVGHRTSHIELLGEIQVLRGYLHERSTPVRMILEHLAIVTPRGLGEQ